MFKILSLTFVSTIKSLFSTRSGQQKTQKPKSKIVEHVSYSIGYGSSLFEDWIIDDDSQENCQLSETSMDVPEMGFDSPEQMVDGQTERKRPRSESGSSSPTFNDTSNKKFTSSNDESSINDEGVMDTASSTAHIYHQRCPSASELYNTGLGGARGRSSTGVITCCCGQTKTKSETRIISRHDMLPYIERVFTHKDAYDRLKDNDIVCILGRKCDHTGKVNTMPANCRNKELMIAAIGRVCQGDLAKCSIQNLRRR